MGKQIVSIWDDEIAECFELFGGHHTATYFEALRYRQQLTKDAWFSYKGREIRKNTGLTYKRQKLAKDVLEATGFIETQRHSTQTHGNSLFFRLTDTAYDVIKHTKRRRNMTMIKAQYV